MSFAWIECSFDCLRHHPHEIVLPVPEHRNPLAHVGLYLPPNPAGEGDAHSLRLAAMWTQIEPHMGERILVLRNGEDYHVRCIPEAGA